MSGTMAGREHHEDEPVVFDRLQRLAVHERRRRWDSTRNVLGTDAELTEPAAISPKLVAERFEWLEGQVAAMARELRRNESRSRVFSIRLHLAFLLGLLTAIGCIGLWVGMLHPWFDWLPH